MHQDHFPRHRVPLTCMYGVCMYVCINYVILGRFFPRTPYPCVRVFMQLFRVCLPKCRSGQVFLELQ